jgi:transposase
MPVIGLDVHKSVVQAARLDDHGRLLGQHRFPCTREALLDFCATYVTPETRIALEATTHTWAIVDLLEPHCAEVVVSNPMRTRAIAEAKIKTDRVDARVLAQLLRVDFLPRVWRPDERTKTLRRLCTRRASLVSDRTRVKNRLHAVLHQRMMAPPAERLFSKAGLAWLRIVELDAEGRAAIDGDLRLLEQLDAEIAQMDRAMAQQAIGDERVQLLVTLPGVDVAVAEALLSALGDIERFRDADHAASYLGLVPSIKQSANHCYHGPITKQGRSHARWMLVQAAQHVGRHPGPLGVFFRRLAKKKNRNVAVVACARKLVTIAWHMLKNGEPYRYAQPAVTEGKLARLRVRGGGERRKASTKGQPRTTSYGSGKRTRRVPGLPEVYEREGLPAIRELSAGEQRTIRSTGTKRYVDSIQHEQRIERRRGVGDELND